MENAKLEMLSTMVTSALANIIDENSKSEITADDVRDWFLKASHDDVRSIGFDYIYDELHDNDLQEMTGHYLNTLNNDNRLSDFILENNLGFLKTINRDDVVNFLKGLDKSDLFDILNEADVMTDITEEVQDDCVDDWLANVDASDLVEKCCSSLEDDLRDYFEEDFRDRAHNAIDNM